MAQIKKIVIEIDDKEIELTLEQAKGLYDKLKELVGDRESIYIPYPVYPPYDPHPIPWVAPWTWCSTNSDVGVYRLTLTS